MKFVRLLSVITVVVLIATMLYGCGKKDDDMDIVSFEEAYSEALEEQQNQPQEDIISENEDGSKSITYGNPTVVTEDTYYLNGQKIKLPMSYAEFSSLTGYEYTSSSLAQDDIDPGQYYLALSLTSSSLENKDASVDIPAINYTDSKASVEDLSVIGIYVYGTEEVDFKMESGLTVGQAATIDDIIAIYGTPDYSTIEADGVNGSVEYHYSTDTSYQALTIHIQDGAIYEIGMTIPF